MPLASSAVCHRARLSLWLLLPISAAACDIAYPEVVIVNRTAPQMQLRHISFNGCLWEGVLAYGEQTAVARCLPGKGRVHFQRFDALGYGAIDEDCDKTDSCPLDGGPQKPLWFNYQTISEQSAPLGTFQIFEIALDGMEQDFSLPGPWGH